MSPVPFDFQSECPHASICPGCPLIHAPYGDQLAQKALQVERALEGFDDLSGLRVAATVPAQRVEGYRTRAKMVVGRDGALGLYARGSHDVIDLPGCRVLHPILHGVTATLRQLGQRDGFVGVDLALIGSRVMVTFIVDVDAERDLFAHFAQALALRDPSVASVALSRRQPDAVQLLASNHELLLGDPEVRAESPSKESFHYAAHGAFLQVHADTSSSIYEQIRQQVRSIQGSRPRVLELYAGSGALALSLAAAGASVTAVESFVPACERLTRAAREQRLTLEVITGDAAVLASSLAQAARRFDIVIVNPPRRGLDTEVRTAIVALEPSEIMYVSCNPKTLARDLAHFARVGYRAETLAPFDMMPLTDQVETWVRLTRGEASLPPILFEQRGLIAVSKGPHERVESSGDTEPTLETRVRRLPGCAHAVSLTALEEETSGVCLFAREPSDVESARQVVARSSATFLVLAKGVMHKRGRIERSLQEGTASRKVSLRYVRLSVEGGHSFVKVELDAASSHAIGKLLASVGHPVIGSRKGSERGTQTHFKMRHGLSRPFVHCAERKLSLDEQEVCIAAQLPGDLARVLESLRESGSKKAR